MNNSPNDTANFDRMPVSVDDCQLTLACVGGQGCVQCGGSGCLNCVTALNRFQDLGADELKEPGYLYDAMRRLSATDYPVHLASALWHGMTVGYRYALAANNQGLYHFMVICKDNKDHWKRYWITLTQGDPFRLMFNELSRQMETSQEYLRIYTNLNLDSEANRLDRVEITQANTVGDLNVPNDVLVELLVMKVNERSEFFKTTEKKRKGVEALYPEDVYPRKKQQPADGGHEEAKEGGDGEDDESHNEEGGE